MAINLDEFDPEEQLDIQAELDEGYADIENQCVLLDEMVSWAEY